MAREAHRAGISRFIFLSSLQVNGPETPAGKRFYADSLPRPKSPIGKALLEAEKELTRVGEETGMEICDRPSSADLRSRLPKPLRRSQDHGGLLSAASAEILQEKPPFFSRNRQPC